MKKENTNKIIGSLIYIVIGVILIIYPTIIGETVCYMLAGAAAAMGVIEIIAYTRADVETRVMGNSNGLAQGILLILLGIFVVVKKVLVISLIPFILGFMITTKGILSIQSAINLRNFDYGNFKVNIIASSIISIFGVVMMLNPFSTAKALFIMIGLGLVVSGLADIAFSILIGKEISKPKDEFDF